MKKIFSIFALAIITAAGFTACNDDDNEWVDPNGDPLKVISNDTSFGAVASTGSIVVDATDPVTVTSNDNGWVTTTVNGNTIEVAVTANTGLEGRVATLTIKSGSKKTDVSIVQSGAIFKIELDRVYRTTDAAYTVTVPIVANLPVSFATSGDWITANYDEEAGTVTISLTANTTKHMRQGFVEYTCGTASGRIPVKQCAFATDLVGDYELIYQNPANGNYYYFEAKLTGTASNCKIELPKFDFTIPVTYNASDFSFKIAAGSNIGTYMYQGVEHQVGTVLFDVDAGYLTFNTAVSITGVTENGYLSTGDLVTRVRFEDNGSWSGYNITTLTLGLFTSTTFNNSSWVGALVHLTEPYLIRTDVPAPSTDAATSTKGMKINRVKPMLVNSLQLLPADNVKIAY